ncbi:MAG: glutathione S-transferase N-terminal domain-containing protein [Myxococcota bacterium]
MYKLYSWEHSYFSGKVRAYLRFKQSQGDLGQGFEDILATPELIAGRLTPRSGSGAVPQLETPSGDWIQDSSSIIDHCEAAHPGLALIPDLEMRPRQRLASYLIELLADEWTVVPAFWQRWFFSENGREPSHRTFNEQQWGAVMNPDGRGPERQAAGAGFFEAAFGISDTRENPKGVYAGLVHLGCDDRTERAWQASQHHLLECLETHFAEHDYLLGGRPSLGDYGLLGPLYAHLYRDAVPGFYLRTHFPLVTEWVERTNGESALNARQYGQKLYGLGEAGELVPRVATSDGGDWLPGDAIPETLLPILAIFFDEMWPTLRTSVETLARFLESDDHAESGEVPGKTFIATPGFIEHQTGKGGLTHPFSIGGIESRRMVVPYQAWMLQRLQAANSPDQGALAEFLAPFEQGQEVLSPAKSLADWRIQKEGALLFARRA